MYMDLQTVKSRECLTTCKEQFKYGDILKEHVFDKQPVKGDVTIDKGAYSAMRRGARQFPAGILKVSGNLIMAT